MVNASDPAVLQRVSHLLHYSQSLDQYDGILMTTLQAVKQVYVHPWKQNSDFIAPIQNQRNRLQNCGNVFLNPTGINGKQKSDLDLSVLNVVFHVGV